MVFSGIGEAEQAIVLGRCSDLAGLGNGYGPEVVLQIVAGYESIKRLGSAAFPGDDFHLVGDVFCLDAARNNRDPVTTGGLQVDDRCLIPGHLIDADLFTGGGAVDCLKSQTGGGGILVADQEAVETIAENRR